MREIDGKFVVFNQYLDYERNRWQIRESHEYIILILIKFQQPYTSFSPPYIMIEEAKHSSMLF